MLTECVRSYQAVFGPEGVVSRSGEALATILIGLAVKMFHVKQQNGKRKINPAVGSRPEPR